MPCPVLQTRNPKPVVRPPHRSNQPLRTGSFCLHRSARCCCASSRAWAPTTSWMPLCGGEMNRKMRSKFTRGWMLRCGEMPHLCLQRQQHEGPEAAACDQIAKYACATWSAESM